MATRAQIVKATSEMDGWQYDAHLQFRKVRGEDIARFPAGCRRGDHDLGSVGYNATEFGGILFIWCHGCPCDAQPWKFKTFFHRNRPIPRAEFDYEAYPGLRERLAQRAPKSSVYPSDW